MKKRVWTTAVIIWMMLIFWFSTQPADQSEDMSLSAGRMVGRIFIPEYEQWPQERQIAFARKIDYPVRKAAHASEYALLGFLLAGMYYSYGWTGKRWLILSIASGVLYACSDEFHQLFVPGRAGRISDVLIDSGGVLASVLLVLALRIWGNRQRSE